MYNSEKGRARSDKCVLVGTVPPRWMIVRIKINSVWVRLHLLATIVQQWNREAIVGRMAMPKDAPVHHWSDTLVRCIAESKGSIAIWMRETIMGPCDDMD